MLIRREQRREDASQAQNRLDSDPSPERFSPPPRALPPIHFRPFLGAWGEEGGRARCPRIYKTNA